MAERKSNCGKKIKDNKIFLREMEAGAGLNCWAVKRPLQRSTGVLFSLHSTSLHLLHQFFRVLKWLLTPAQAVADRDSTAEQSRRVVPPAQLPHP